MGKSWEGRAGLLHLGSGFLGFDTALEGTGLCPVGGFVPDLHFRKQHRLSRTSGEKASEQRGEPRRGARGILEGLLLPLVNSWSRKRRVIRVFL